VLASATHSRAVSLIPSHAFVVEVCPAGTHNSLHMTELRGLY